ncbi:hypothetical protein CEQ90_15865 [Lewinellaceae bacterium SD302]|nr:hypothetical protein CEQ90_15865 [Lewinellaceae bacterium SD302]
MKVLVNLLLILLFPICLQSQALNRFQWKNRVLILFTPEPDNPVFQQQFAELKTVVDEMVDRQLITIFVEPSGNFENTTLFVDEAEAAQYYDLYSPKPYQFEMILVGLDGNVKLRATNSVTPAKAIFELIDSMPMRQKQLRKRYGNTGNSNTTNGKDAVRYREW